MGVVGGPVVADLGGMTLVPGTYTSASTILISIDVTLDAQGNSNAVWIFQVGSSLTTVRAFCSPTLLTVAICAFALPFFPFFSSFLFCCSHQSYRASQFAFSFIASDFFCVVVCVLCC